MGLISEFKTFALKGNVLDMAVGIIIGAAFGKIVSALVDNILMPVIGIMMQGKDFSELAVQVGDASVKYGLFIQNTIDFIIIAFVLFLIIKGANNLKKKEEAPPPPAGPTPTEKLLTEIRDSLRK
ncbi:MAG: large-conductance mechanosensitive channel protein MscL [Bacteroidia bacterium]|nr:large-conductance mechanosensitive channel protein MscL [Bacteroidia bacterium]MCZ2277811.1 large-conductance mechanosensitive channel protein MscL [Bacteroidia bacterium]